MTLKLEIRFQLVTQNKKWANLIDETSLDKKLRVANKSCTGSWSCLLLFIEECKQANTVGI